MHVRSFLTDRPDCLQRLGSLGYLLVGLAAATPCVALPLLLQLPRSESQKPLLQVPQSRYAYVSLPPTNHLPSCLESHVLAYLNKCAFCL